MDHPTFERLATVLLVATALSIVATRLIEEAARRLQVLDVPNPRSSHSSPTPRLGGVAVLAATVVAWGLSGPAPGVEVWVVVGAAIALASVGLIDDFRPLSSALRLFLQTIAAGVMVVVSAPTMEIDLGPLDLVVGGVIAHVCVGLFIVAVVNAVNFMDGIDGMAAGVAVANSLAIAAIARPDAAVLLLALGGACIGFLAWNVHPASIFLGDSGSLFIGTVLVGSVALGSAALGVGSDPTGGSVPVIPALLIFAPFLYDTGVTIVRRALRREPLLVAHRSHLYQRLAATQGHRPVANYYVAAATLFGLGAIVYQAGTDVTKMAVLLGAFVILAVVGLLVDMRRLK